MLNLQFRKDFQEVRKLPFCYLCGKNFSAGDELNRDHVPPKNIFGPNDKEPALVLRVHKSCNGKYSDLDKKIGQLIGLRLGRSPNSKRDHALKLVHYTQHNMIAVENINVDAAIWRWVTAFHAALYREPNHEKEGTLQTPFPRADKKNGEVFLEPILPQHTAFVEIIKRNRALQNTDQITANNRKLRYHCVWCKFDSSSKWFCTFAVDIYDWKDLGSNTQSIPRRGCVGFYAIPGFSHPNQAATDKDCRLILPNYDVLDAFAP